MFVVSTSDDAQEAQEGAESAAPVPTYSNDSMNNQGSDVGNEEMRERMRQLGLRSGAVRRERAASPSGSPHAPPPSEASTLRLMMAVQESIALGKSKGATATQQTQAAKAWSELRLALQGLEAEEDATRYDLHALHDRYDLLDYVVTLSVEEMAAMREWVEEGGVGARMGEASGAPPHPPARRASVRVESRTPAPHTHSQDDSVSTPPFGTIPTLDT